MTINSTPPTLESVQAVPSEQDTRVLIASVQDDILAIGLKSLAVFAVLILGVILASHPPNIAIALSFPLSWLLLLVIALKFARLRQKVGLIIALGTTLMAIPLVFTNGLAPAVLLPLGLLIPLTLMRGWIRLVSIIVLVCSGFFVPFSKVPYDPAVWSRLMVTQVVLGGSYIAIILYLEKLMVKNRLQFEKLNKALQRAEQFNQDLSRSRERQSQMCSIVGHELRTPLSSMKMMEDAMGLKDIGEYGRNICDSTDSLLAIVDDLRTVINPEKAHQAAAVVDSPFDVLTRTTLSLEGLYAQQGVNVKVSSDQLSHSLCKFNAQALRQKITNLTKNAAIHADADTVWVDLQAQPLNDTQIALTLVVEDNGKGIPEGLREAVFGAFSRGDTRAEGTGLGLYITRELAEKLGGSVEYFDSDKGGAGFRAEFTLDLHLSAEEQEQVEESVPVALQGKRILLAEDQKTLQLLTSKLLKDAGADVVVCDNGKQALEAFHEGEFDIVLTDLMMPEMNGDELIRHIRAEGFAGQVVALTAAIIGKETDILLQAGADAVLNKPLNIDEMKRTIAALETKEGNAA